VAGVPWVDTFVSVPTVGLQTKPNFGALFTYPEKLQPMLDEAMERERELSFGLDRNGNGFQFRTEKGFTYTVNVNNIVVAFEYTPKDTQAAGALPLPELPPVEPFSALVEQTVQQMVRVLSLVATAEHPQVLRFGLAVKSLMERSKAPPGITEMITHQTSFYPGEPIKAQTAYLVNIEKTRTYTDRCHHHYLFDEVEKRDDLTVLLDWQRVFETPIRLSSQVADTLRPMKDAALAYFEKVGKGGLRDG